MLHVVEATQQKLINPSRQASNAKPIVSLWRALGHPPPGELAEDLAAVAEAARDCAESIFARDLRAEGWPDGKDRSRSVAALCRFAPGNGSSGATFDERVDAARKHKAGTCACHVKSAVLARAPPNGHRPDMFAMLEAFRERENETIDADFHEVRRER